MRIYSDIDLERKRIVVTFAQDVTLDDIKEMVYTSGKAGVLSFRGVADARNASFKLSPGDLPEFQDLLREIASQSRLGQTAVLVSDEAAMATVEMLSGLASEVCLVKGFFDRAEAEQWLGWKD